MCKFIRYSSLLIRSCKVLKLRKSYARNLCTDKSEIIFDLDYICNIKNKAEIEDNIKHRGSVANISLIHDLFDRLKSTKDKSEILKLNGDFERELFLLPNRSSPHVLGFGGVPRLVKEIGKKPDYDFKPKEFHDLVQNLHVLLTHKIFSLFTGDRSHYFIGVFAELERALINSAVSMLIQNGFTLLSVPDLLYSDVIERCGMKTTGIRSQVYHITNFSRDVCLSGTSEMAIGGYLQNKEFKLSELPAKFAAVSKCYRQEVGNDSSERGIYRVHQFTKVEMFGVTANEDRHESDQLYQEIIDIQTKFYRGLDLHFKVLDMPIFELGDPAYSKTDIEAWFPGKEAYGEITSASNCTDYQSRRLNIMYRDADGKQRFCHTVNGTAVAIPRCIMAIGSTHQQKDGSINLPTSLHPYLNFKSIKRTKNPMNVERFHNRTFPGTVVKP